MSSVLYNISLQLIYFIHNICICLSLAIPLSPLPVGNCQFSVSMFLFCYIHSFIFLIFRFHISDNNIDLSLTYFTKHSTVQVHLCYYYWQNFIPFLWLNNILCVCVCVCVCVFAHILYIPRVSLFIHLLMDTWVALFSQPL